MISMTEAAVKQIQKQLKNRGHGLGIRLGVQTTGCSGLSYVLEFVDETDHTDFPIQFDGYTVFVEGKSSVYLSGMTVDYVKHGLNEGFEFSNPNAKGECGCGESFTV